MPNPGGRGRNGFGLTLVKQRIRSARGYDHSLYKIQFSVADWSVSFFPFNNRRRASRRDDFGAVGFMVDELAPRHKTVPVPLAEANRGRLLVGFTPTHIKEIVVDSEYFIAGSNNWLSNSRFENGEASWKIYDRTLAREVRDEVIQSVRNSPMSDVE